jgi:hypothetical protein
MANWFGQWRGRKITPTIDALSLDASAWTYHGEKQPGQMRLWETPDHDAVSLHFFAKPPDLPAVASMAALAANYAEGLKPARGTVVECILARVAGCPAVRLLIKAPQKPTGMLYQGVFTLPFRDFSFVVKIQCAESGTTGAREAILLDQRMKAGETPNLGGGGPMFPGWNPDAPEHDKQFPTHPISRLRHLLDHVARTATMDAAVRELPSFQLPGSD